MQGPTRSRTENRMEVLSLPLGRPMRCPTSRKRVVLWAWSWIARASTDAVADRRLFEPMAATPSSSEAMRTAAGGAALDQLRRGEVGRQPAPALGQGLGVGVDLLHRLQGAPPHQVVRDPQQDLGADLQGRVHKQVEGLPHRALRWSSPPGRRRSRRCLARWRQDVLHRAQGDVVHEGAEAHGRAASPPGGCTSPGARSRPPAGGAAGGARRRGSRPDGAHVGLGHGALVGSQDVVQHLLLPAGDVGADVAAALDAGHLHRRWRAG